MRVYEASIQYSLVQLGDDIALSDAAAVYAYMQSAFQKNPAQESFWVILINRKNHAIGRVLISQGTVSSCPVAAADVFRPAIVAAGCSGIIVTHAHPSGDPTPSGADLAVTKTLREASRVLGLELIDHVICGQRESDPNGVGHYSFRQAGLL